MKNRFWTSKTEQNYNRWRLLNPNAQLVACCISLQSFYPRRYRREDLAQLLSMPLSATNIVEDRNVHNTCYYVDRYTYQHKNRCAKCNILKEDLTLCSETSGIKFKVPKQWTTIVQDRKGWHDQNEAFGQQWNQFEVERLISL